MSRHVVLEIRHGVVQRYTVRFEEGVHFESRLELKQTPHLPFRQRARAIRVDGERFERLPRQIRPATLEDCRDVVRANRV
jgi:hypothetical protein